MKNKNPKESANKALNETAAPDIEAPQKPDVPQNRPELMDLYKIAVDEYRFQVKLNADRSRDYLVLNSAVIAAGVTLLGQKAYLLAGCVFLAGSCVAVLSELATHTQHNYYRQTRDAKGLLESRLGISDAVVKTTPATGSRRWRLASVTRFNYIVLTMLCVVDIAGASFGFSNWAQTQKPLTIPHAKTSSTAAQQHQSQPLKSLPIQATPPAPHKP